MGKKVAKPTTAATKRLADAKRERARYKDYNRAIVHGEEWLATCDRFDALKFVNKMGMKIPWSGRYPWAQCPFSDLRKRLRSEGRHYTHMFIEVVQDGFKAEYSALVFHRHREGVEDGRRWASKYARGGQHVRISKFARSYWTRAIFVGPDPCESWTPSHRLVTYLLDDAYPIGEDGKQLVDCTEFREFWQPFVNEPMTKVLANLEHYGYRAGHKLQDRNYIAGFVDGALGLSEQIGRQLSERTPTPLPNNEHTHIEC